MYLDVRNLQHFVTISLATAVGGEGDYARDLLASLRTVAGGFEELIYKLPLETGYKELEKKCEVLWETLRNTPDLPNLLVSDPYYSCNYVRIKFDNDVLFEFKNNKAMSSGKYSLCFCSEYIEILQPCSNNTQPLNSTGTDYALKL